MTPNLTITNKIITQLFLIFLLLVVNTHQQRVINYVILYEERTVEMFLENLETRNFHLKSNSIISVFINISLALMKASALS
jgi:hypothetical protein